MVSESLKTEIKFTLMPDEPQVEIDKFNKTLRSKQKVLGSMAAFFAVVSYSMSGIIPLISIVSAAMIPKMILGVISKKTDDGVKRSYDSYSEHFKKERRVSNLAAIAFAGAAGVYSIYFAVPQAQEKAQAEQKLRAQEEWARQVKFEKRVRSLPIVQAGQVVGVVEIPKTAGDFCGSQYSPGQSGPNDSSISSLSIRVINGEIFAIEGCKEYKPVTDNAQGRFIPTLNKDVTPAAPPAP